MSHAFPESRSVPDDHLLVRPYVAPSSPPADAAHPAGPVRATGPAWPQTGPVTFPGPIPGVRPAAPEPASGPASRKATAPGTGPDRGGRLPASLLGLLALFALAAAGGLVLLLSGPDPEPARAVPPPGLPVPVLPQRDPDATADEPAVPAPETSPAPATPAPAGAGSAPESASPGPTGSSARKPPPSASPTPPPAADGTLRPGDRGPEVRALQERLHGQGFTYVTVNGVYDDRTRRGVAQLQSDRGIEGDPEGTYGPATRSAFD